MATSYRILHVDDNALTRELVELSLGLDPAFALLSCTDANEALNVAADWGPDLVLAEAKMPDTDGPALLARLRADPVTAKFPVVFLSACAEDGDVDAMRALGAAGVIAKPFDPATLALTLRRFLYSIRMNAAGYDFYERLRRDAATLAAFRGQLNAAPPAELQSFAHKLAGAAGVFNYRAVSAQASALEDAIIAVRAGCGAREAVAAKLDALLECIERASLSQLEPDRKH
jgi:two-component system OmpR family response regulator